MAVPSTPADGNVKYAVVTTIADPTAPTAAELTAGVDISCYLTGDGWAPSTDQQTIADQRACDREDYAKPGRVSNSLTLTYIENPGSATDNEAWDALEPGSDVFVVQRRGADYEDAFAAGDVVDVWPVTAGEYQPQPPTANSVFTVQQAMFTRSPGVQRSVTVA